MHFRLYISDPKVMLMGASGAMAFFLKFIVCVLIAMPLSFLAALPTLSESLRIFTLHPLLNMFILYPAIGIIVDLLLYANKKKIEQFTLDPNAIPINWHMTPEALLHYATHGPKVRLMRLIACWTPVTVALMPFDASMLLEIMIGFGLGFFFFALFDRLWASVLNIKAPHLIAQFISMHDSIIMLAKQCAPSSK
jgi:hypothetical protein